MATFKVRANELSGITGLYVYLYPPGEALANTGGDALSESSGLFTATVSESLSGIHDYYIGTSTTDVLYRGKVDCVGSTWIADDNGQDITVEDQSITVE